MLLKACGKGCAKGSTTYTIIRSCYFTLSSNISSLLFVKSGVLSKGTLLPQFQHMLLQHTATTSGFNRQVVNIGFLETQTQSIVCSYNVAQGSWASRASFVVCIQIQNQLRGGAFFVCVESHRGATLKDLSYLRSLVRSVIGVRIGVSVLLQQVKDYCKV